MNMKEMHVMPNVIILLTVMLLFGLPGITLAEDRFGFDTDLIAYRIGEFPESFFLSGWYGWERLKLSVTAAHLKLVEAHTHDGFTNESDSVYGLGLDYLFNGHRSGFSCGPRLIYIDGVATSQKNQQRGDYQHFSAGINLGYLWNITDHLYLMPNVNVLVPLGETKFAIGADDTYEATWNLEPGFRIGWEF